MGELGVINIPQDYWSGNTHLDLGIPWFVPQAIRRLEQILDKHRDFSILEFGGGGSTLFFAERCKEIMTIEHNPTWANEVRVQLLNKGLNNAIIRNPVNLDEYIRIINNIASHSCDIILFDSDCKFITRNQIGAMAMSKLKYNGLVIVDNYYLRDNIIDELSYGWTCEDYTDIHWYGNGTRLAYKDVERFRV